MRSKNFSVAVSIFFAVLFVTFFAANAIANEAENLAISASADGRGTVTTGRGIYVTNDNGATWRRITIELGLTETITFADQRGNERFVLITNGKELMLARSSDDGLTWDRDTLVIDSNYLAQANLSSAELYPDGETIFITFDLESGSNFVRTAQFVSNDDGKSWKLGYSSSQKKRDRSNDDSRYERAKRELGLADDEAITNDSGTGWYVVRSGKCYGFKSGCVQAERIIRSDGEDITPVAIKQAADRARDAARLEATPQFALPPGGNTRISLNRGFDKCQAGSVSQMQTWWNTSPHYDTNIYFSGRNRACASQPLNTTWIDQVTAQGWGLIPTVVGYQSPCTVSTTSAKLSYDVAVAESQGRIEADIAATDAANIGLTAGSILYYDMERYDPPTPDTLGCRSATVAFLKGWTERIKQLGYKSGVYGSPKNAIEDWQFMAPTSKMDAVWMARWDNVASVWTYVSFPTFPANEWANHQRIKQWQAPHNETWGGITFNIDGNISDAPVAGLAIARNTIADFDGDRKSDVSVYRPDTGVWYVQNSATSTFTIVPFGAVGDVLAPGDYDGDGKTDMCVFRPSTGVWHILTKAGQYSARPFGTTNDIPAPADYNGDGKTDLAVFRPSNATWYISNSDSQGTFSFVAFGTNGDLPVRGDFDGDAKDDIAIFRPNGGTGSEWWVQRSSDSSVFALQFGTPTDKTVAGDFTGDGKADIAFWRPSTGYWYVLRSEDLSFYAVPYGTTGDLPSPGDYDGDGRFDTAVFRPSTGVWYVDRSTAGSLIQQFGQSGDAPVSGSIVR